MYSVDQIKDAATELKLIFFHSTADFRVSQKILKVTVCPLEKLEMLIKFYYDFFQMVNYKICTLNLERCANLHKCLIFQFL